MPIRMEQSHDREAIAKLHEEAFGNRLEAELVDQLRASGEAVLSVVFEVDGGEIAGHILYSRLTLQDTRAVALAPMAVQVAYQRQGIGTQLVRASLEMLRQKGEHAVFVLGHRGYYPRFGFRNDLAAHFDSPYAGASFFALELEPNSLLGKAGPVRFAPAFAVFE
jgi:putative acetyltransferase